MTFFWSLALAPPFGCARQAATENSGIISEN
jgi:hypothetical protein